MTFFIFIYTLTAFLGASLLFIVQPMVGKLTLPMFGGVSSVWTAVMLFFTSMLLLGYGYVVWLVKKPRKQQFFLHGALILITLVWLVLNFWKTRTFFPAVQSPDLSNMPVVFLIVMMVKILALPSFLLASTGTLLQSWYSRVYTGKSPYWLYIVSNVGSLLGLLAYPFVIEPHLSLLVQQSLWVFGFIVYSFLIMIVTYAVFRAVKEVRSSQKYYKMSLRRGWLWFIFPFISTTAMLAFTNQITYEIAPVPFIWVATLGVYLLSFIIAFIEGAWYPRKYVGAVLLVLIGILSLFASGYISLGFRYVFPFALLTLFVIDVACHRELFGQRPKSEALSTYYLFVALGGVAASVFVAIIAPIVFNNFWEFPLTLVASVIVGIYILFKRSSFVFRASAGVFGTLIIALISWLFIFYSQKSLGEIPNTKLFANFRSFYGVLHILKTGSTTPYIIELVNGVTSHGSQIIGNSDEYIPKTNYTYNSGLGFAILHHPKKLEKKPMRIGMIGMGIGMTAAYCGSVDSIRFYEINPQVIEISKHYFTYLSNAEKAGCRLDIVPGDARISLEKELKSGQKGQFDILVMDAFNNDSMPVHLLTREAMDTYLSHLSDQGIIVFHIQTLYFNFAQVLESLASVEKLYFTRITAGGGRWVSMSKFPTGPQSYIPSTENAKTPPWTDDYGDILQYLIY